MIEQKPRTSDFDVNEVHVMGSDMHNSPEEDLVGDLPMEPDILIRGECPGELWADDTNNVA